MPENIKVCYKGSLPQNQVVDIMRGYHGFLFPTLSENFGHVMVEAMQAGLIPVISDQTPWLKLESVNAGWDIPLGEDKQYIQAIEKLYVMSSEDYTKSSSDVMSYISNTLKMGKLKYEYIDFFNKVIKAKNV